MSGFSQEMTRETMLRHVADMRLKEPVENAAEAAALPHDDDHSVGGGVSGGVGSGVNSGIGGVTGSAVTGGVGDGVSGHGIPSGVGEHLDPSRLPLAQRHLFMRIQQKQHRDDVSNKPISEVTAKRASCACVY